MGSWLPSLIFLSSLWQCLAGHLEELEGGRKSEGERDDELREEEVEAGRKGGKREVEG